MYSCMQKMLKETKTKETIKFFVLFLSMVAFQWGRGGPLGYTHAHLNIGLQIHDFCFSRAGVRLLKFQSHRRLR